VKGAVAFAVVAALYAPSAEAAEPLVPRDLSELSRYRSTLVEVTRAGVPLVRAQSAVPVAPSFGIWSLPSAQALRVIPRLARLGALVEFSPDRPLSPAGHITAGDPLLPQQWWYPRVGADLVEPPGPGVAVLIADSGLDVTHPEFAGRPDTELLTAQGTQGPREFHGTAVASVVGAPANGVGVVGVYPQARLASWDVSPRGVPFTRQLVSALEAAAGRGRSIVNISLGAPFPDRLVEHAVLNAYERGVIVVAAAGNAGEAGNEESFPGALPHVVTVASTDAADRVSTFSTRSAAVDIAAPGEGIPVAVPLDADPSGYSVEFGTGTSFSSPIVAGALAWLWSARPGLDKTQVVEILRRTARDVGVPGRDDQSGHGLLDIPAALGAPTPAADPLEPNDDVEQVMRGNLFDRTKPLVTSPGRARAVLRARLDGSEDPEDVYRVWVPAQRVVTVSLRSSTDLDFLVWEERTPTLSFASRRFIVARSAHRGSGTERTTVQNTARRGYVVLVDVFPRSEAPLLEASYTLSITTARARR
jgi:hypothetical protein